MMTDLRFAVRQLFKSPGFTVVAVMTLALGIGANTAIFTLVSGVLLRPLPYPQADRIVYFEGQNPAAGISDSNISIADYLDWAEQTDLFASTGLFAVGSGTLAADGNEPERVPRAAVTSGFFSVLGAQPMLGRPLLAEDDQENAEEVAVLSAGLWKRRFGADPNIVGRKLTVSGRPVTVVGVMSSGYEYPEQTEIWTSWSTASEEKRRDNRSASAVARLRAGVDLKKAQAQISAINARLAQAHPDTNKGWDARLVPLHDLLVRSVRPSLLLLLGAVAFVLLIACANVGNLLLARAATRHREVAIRTAMGASRGRIIRQMLTESLLLSGIGAIGGVFFSVWLTDILLSAMPEGAPGLDQVGFDYRVLAFAVLISAGTGIVFGLAPALQTSKLDVSSSLKEGGRTGDGPWRTPTRILLLTGEVALSLMLLIGAGLLIKSFLRLQEVKAGFNPHGVLITSVGLPRAKYKEPAQRIEFFRQLQERVASLPGVHSVGGAVNLPLGASNYQLGRAFIPEGRPLTIEESVNASYATITGDYFRALQIPLLAGRSFTETDTDGAPKVVVVNESVARRYFGSANAALGKRLTVWRDETFPREIVGVVGDTKPDTLEGANSAQIYVPHAQDSDWGFMAMVVRTGSDPAALAPAVRREVQSLDKDQPVYNVRTMDEVVLNSIRTRRLSTLLFTAFAGAALLLAAMGIYGVMAYSVSQRVREIGIRMALGAQAGDVLRMIVRQGMTLTVAGVAVGLIGALGLSRVLASLLFGTNAIDPITFVGIPLLLGLVALIACYLPARRAAHVDPNKVLAHG
ncbi:MAG TPA: ABC transporter permease [Chthoniobacterales bacterium]|nr:ABC transporter permease [Chthoniobacterales bacterium]